MSLADYSDLEQEIEEAQEPTILPRGTEVMARIISMMEGISDKNGAQWYMPVFDIPDKPESLEFNDFFWDLADRDKLEPKAATRSLNKFKNFAAAFSVDYSRPFDWEELIGKEGWVILGVKKDEEWGDKNTVSKYVAGRKGSITVETADENDDNAPF